jgi:hypothetical protein
MSVPSISGVSKSSGSDSSAVQSDYRVRQLESQIEDWSTCPTTPPDQKKAIVTNLQFQLDSAKSTIENQQKAVQAANQASAKSGGSVPAVGQPTLAARYVSPFKVDTYA